MNLKIVTCALFVAPLLAHADAYQSLLRRYEKQIEKQSKQLQSLRARLADNDREASRWQKKGEQAKEQWSQVSHEADRARQKADEAKEQWVKTRRLAEAVEWETATQTLLSQSAHQELSSMARELYGRQLLSLSQGVSPEERMPEFLIQELSGVADTASQVAQKAGEEQVRLRTNELKLKSDEQERRQAWGRLRQEQQSYWLKWQEAMRKRSALIEEKGQMEQSEQALSIMLRNLRDDKQRAMAARQGRTGVSDTALASLRGTLPWPAYGKIVQEFGRSQSTDLRQLVISNGIKIETGAEKSVRCIAPGKVIFAAPFRSYGQLVIIQHKTGLTSVYGGLGEVRVKEGDLLTALDGIGVTSDAGSFYFELRRDERPINPMVYLVPLRSQEISSRRTYP